MKVLLVILVVSIGLGVVLFAGWMLGVIRAEAVGGGQEGDSDSWEELPAEEQAYLKRFFR